MEAESRGFVRPYWLTDKQAQELGGHDNKGEHGAPVDYPNSFKKSETADNDDEAERDIPFLKQYTVFAAD